MASPTQYNADDRDLNSTKFGVPNMSATPNRRVLGDVSPNVRKQSPAAALLTRKPIAGSPLKRSFNAVLESGEGLTYLKKRKLSDDDLLAGFGYAHQQAPIDQLDLNVNASNVRGFLQPDDMTDSIQLPAEETSPTEPNTPSDAEDSQGSSVERKSFSSLINYDSSSQPATLMLNGMTRAEMLRLRLRIAMYKVRTNQTHVPFAELRLEPKVTQPSTSEAVEEAVAALRREAQQTSTTSAFTSIPKLLPGPTLLPTAYSSRMIYDSHIASSPPVLGSPDRLPAVSSSIMTPQRAGRLQYGTPGTADRWRGPSDQELTSSVVKGRVAEGLLGLRNAV